MAIARLSVVSTVMALVLLATACNDDPADPMQNDGDTVTLTVVAEGGSSVQFYDNLGVLHKCGDPQVVGAPNQCSAEILRDFPVDIQRTLSLPLAEEGRYRLATWGGACLGVDVPNLPRGGHCQLTMNADKNVLVNFEQRARVVVTHSSPNAMSIRWDAAFSAQKSGGNPLTRGGTFDCNFPSNLPTCSIDAMYDLGTTLTLNVGAGPALPANWQGWGGACASFAKARTCVLTLNADVNVTGSWAFD